MNILCIYTYVYGLSRWLSGKKNQPASTGDIGDMGSTPGSGRNPGGGNGHPLQYSCLENPIDGGASLATVHGVVEELNMT